MKFLASILIFASTFPVKAAIEVTSMQPIAQRIRQQIQRHGVDQLLIVLDIDNTLLASNHQLGSQAWTNWQEELIRESSPLAVTDNFSRLYQIMNTLYTMGHMSPPEPQIPTMLKQLQNAGVKVIALTARGPDMRSATEREMLRNGYDLRQSSIHQGAPGTYLPDLPSPRAVSFQNGIYMTAGQHKGRMLIDLLKKTGQRFKSLVFVDDSQKNVDHMDEAFNQYGIDGYSFRYGKMDPRVGQFRTSDKTAVTRQWQQLQSTLKAVFNRTL